MHGGGDGHGGGRRIPGLALIVAMTLLAGAPGTANAAATGGTAGAAEPPQAEPPQEPLNTVRVRLRLTGDAPDEPSFAVRVRCLGADLDRWEEVLDLGEGPATLVIVPADHPRCIVHRLDAEPPTATRYAVTSLTAETSDRPRSGRMFFTGHGGERARVLLMIQAAGGCPVPGPTRC